MAHDLIETPTRRSLEAQAVTTLRMLALDAIAEANSGHPGIALGLAPVAWVVATRLLRFDPAEPTWVARDRLVLSAGHGSALLYALLHLLGYGIGIDDLGRFRQLGSLTPGHPEAGHTPGVEVTTGPLGQGLATAVGIAMASRRFAVETDGVIAPTVHVLASDGDLLEGVSHEAAALAGQLGLGNLIVGWDANGITIDGPLDLCSRTDEPARFRSYGWRVLEVADPEDLDAVEACWREALAETDRPTLVVCPTVIGRGVPGLAGTAAVHGQPLAPDLVAATKEAYGWPVEPRFYVPEAVRAHIDDLAAERHAEAARWRRRHGAITPTLWQGVPEGWTPPTLQTDAPRATRHASREVLEEVCQLPGVIGGSADLSESTGTDVSGLLMSRACPTGTVVRFGVREHAMAAAANGLALCGLRPWIATFLVFSDYLRPALRLACLMGLPVIYVFSHDSVQVGEDGPTHQPVEHLDALRSMPNLAVIRPADATETVEAWMTALAREEGPTAIILTRQVVPPLPATTQPGWLARDGARIVQDATAIDVVLAASGSEVASALEAAAGLRARGIEARVVSVPWRERCLEASGELLDAAEAPRVVLEAGRGSGWRALVGPGDRVLGIERFGMSGRGPEVLEALGLSAERVVAAAEELVAVPRGEARALLRATEEAAIAAQPLVGRGDKEAADRACVEAMREALAVGPIASTVVIGEGEKDAAPMLVAGERLGRGGPAIDLALDPLEGTTLAARGLPGAISVVAAARSLVALPGFYAEKLIAPRAAREIVDLDRPLVDNAKAVAAALGRPLAATPVAVLAKPRHVDQIAALRAAGIPVIEVPDGDVVAALAVLTGLGPAALVWGIGGVPEGVITAVAAKALGGAFLMRLAPQRPEEREVVRATIPDFEDRVYSAATLVGADPTVVATAVTDAGELRAPAEVPGGVRVTSLVVAEVRWRVVRRCVVRGGGW